MDKDWIKFRWYQEHYPHRDRDQLVQPFLSAPIAKSWIESARKALFLSSREVAKKMGVSKSSYLNFETSEKLEQISQKNLGRCAEAMGCELVYAIRPKEKIRFSDVIWREVDSPTLGQICMKMYDPKFRKAKGWASNTEREAKDFLFYINAMRTRG